MIYNYQGNGIISKLSSLEESITYGYTDPSDLAFNTDDYGNTTELATESIDYEDFSLAIQEEDNGSILVLGNVEPFGGLSLYGSANTEWVNKNLFGSGEYRVVYSPDNTSGTLFSFGEKIESVAYVYTDPSSLAFNVDDYGLISEAHSESIDYSQDLSPTDNKEDNGSILVLGNIEPFGGLILSGSANTQWINKNFSGAGEYRVVYSPDNTSGTLFSFGEKIESVAYVYTDPSSLAFNVDDYGSITELAAESIDYDQDLSPTDNIEDNGSILISESIDPFGGITLSGSALTQVNYRLFLFGQATEIKLTYSPDNTSGTLFSFGEKIESRTYDYNETAIFTYDELDYGFVSQSTNQFDEDYVSVANPADANIDNGILFGVTETILPFGGLTFSGSAIEKITADTPDDTQLFSISGSALEKDTESYVTVGIATFSGSVVERNTESYVGIGTLFYFGEKIESRTYAYNETSIFTFDDLDYGFVSQSTDQFDEDYASIANPADANIDNGNLVGFGATETILPFGGLTFSGSAIEKITADTPDDTQLFSISGSALEKDTESYVTVGIATFSGSVVERNTESYVGIGTLFYFGEKIESRTYAYNETSILPFGRSTFSGSALESFSAQTPEDIQLFSIFGELVHPNIDYTPHYGIEKNIGIGTTGIQFSGSAVERDAESYVGSGVITLNQLTSALESFTVQLPEDAVLYTFSGSALESFSAQTPEDTILYTFDGVARTYSPIYPKNSGDPGAGIGTIRINDDAGLTITRALIPYFGRGTIFLSGNGFESFSIINYDGSGVLTFSGISSNREINVYQDYVTSGLITISQETQPIIEKHTESYVGIGNIIKFGTLSDERIINDYAASGNINLGKTILGNTCDESEQFGSSTTAFDSTLETFDTLCYASGNEVVFSSALESYSAQTPEETVLYTFSGSALESFSAQTPEGTVLYEFSGNIIDERRTYGYSGSGQLTLDSGAASQYVPSIFGFGGFRFTTHLSDNIYDTCDSIDITSDYEDSAFVSFTANPPESTQLFSILGSANTSDINVYEYDGVGNLLFSGSLIDRGTDSYAGIGTLFAFFGANEVDVNSYVGNGSLFAISGSTESKSSQTPENTVLINIFGTASTKLEYEYSYSGIGTAYFSSSALTLFESDYLYSGVGSITLSGELIYPDIKFIPASKGFGLFTLSGISSNSGSYVDELSGNKNIFIFSGGFESFSKSTYIGLGTIYSQEVSSIAINNPFQIPRTYVVII